LLRPPTGDTALRDKIITFAQGLKQYVLALKIAPWASRYYYDLAPSASC
jgi:hypothetical protein